MNSTNATTSGPIFLDELYCTEKDNSLQDCRRGILIIGLTTCSHTEDVWVKCFGKISDHKNELAVNVKPTSSSDI